MSFAEARVTTLSNESSCKATSGRFHPQRHGETQQTVCLATLAPLDTLTSPGPSAPPSSMLLKRMGGEASFLGGLL